MTNALGISTNNIYDLLEDEQGSALNPAERTARATGWYRLAAVCGIPAERVFHYRAAR